MPARPRFASNLIRLSNAGFSYAFDAILKLIGRVLNLIRGLMPLGDLAANYVTSQLVS